MGGGSEGCAPGRVELSAVQALIRDHRNRSAPGHTAERALYAVEEGEEDEDTPNG